MTNLNNNLNNNIAQSFWKSAAIYLALLLSLTHCSTLKRDAMQEAAKETELSKAQQQIVQLQSTVQDLETRISALNEKMNLQMQNEPARASAPSNTQVIQTPVAVVSKHIEVSRPKSKLSEESAIAQNEITDRYREAKILFESNRYSDSIIEFAEFVKNHPNHAFAPAAQYFMGVAYYKQKEYKMAEEEWNRVLIQYPHSQYTADTLRWLTQVSIDLKKPEKSDYYEQKIQMLFAHSPAAVPLKSEPTKTVAAQSHVPPTVAEPKVDAIKEIPELEPSVGDHP